jgi:glutamyl-Q tRNA(Asp) synthetase
LADDQPHQVVIKTRMTRSNPPPVFRFAPSPNGYLHLGHAYSAILNYQMAQASGGRFLLRIEDIDRGRCRPEFEQAIYEDLAWLGLAWEEPVRRQSEHFLDYAKALDRLAAQGLLYSCFCTRGDILKAISAKPDWPRDPDDAPLYPATCRRLSNAERRDKLAAGQNPAQRIDMEKAMRAAGQPLIWHERDTAGEEHDILAQPALWGDAVLSRKDILVSYHIAVVVDDALAGVSDVVRGKDLFMATSLHRLLQDLLVLPQPTYHHHDLVLDEAGRKLSKSHDAKSLRALRQEGLTAEDVYNRFGLTQRGALSRI